MRESATINIICHLLSSKPSPRSDFLCFHLVIYIYQRINEFENIPHDHENSKAGSITFTVIISILLIAFSCGPYKSP